MILVSDSPPQATTTTLPVDPITAFSPVEPRSDQIAALRRDSSSSRSSSYTSSATPTNSSPKPIPSTDSRFNYMPSLALASNSPPLTPIPSHLLQPVDEEPNTPSSTIVEFGDLIRGVVPSAAELVETVHRSFSQSRVGGSEARSRSTPRTTRDVREPREGRDTRERSRNRGITSAAALRDRSQSIHRRSASANNQKTSSLSEKDVASEKGLAEERINRFLHSMAQQAAQSSESELAQENRSLYQRIAALQRTERELLAENQELTRKFNTLKQHHDRRARQWSEGLRRKESEYGARIREMSEQLLNLASTHSNKLLSNEQITSWFDRQDAAWNSWSRAFGHHDADRLSNGLHPLQLKELCGEVKGFVRLTEEGDLPPELVNGGKEAIHTLLNAMLANFICVEILASPLWVFTAASLGTLESPGVIPTNPLPGRPTLGLRMDTSSFSDVAPLRPGPAPTPKSPQFPPPLITSMVPPLGTSASFLGLPVKPDMERLVHMLADAQEESSRVAAHNWRAQMMGLFANGGFSVKDAADVGQNESRRAFVESRLNYARKLKERFLGGAARFLLHNQDSSGIELLERMLTGMIDDALRFSCRLWSRVAPLRLQGWKDIGSKEFRGPNQLVTLCHSQAIGFCDHHHEGCKNKHSGSPARNAGESSVIMVVQPAVVTDALEVKGEKDEPGFEGISLVWLRARVMVAGRMASSLPVSAPAGVGSQPSLPSGTPLDRSNSATPTSLPRRTPKPDTPQPAEVLPASSYDASADPPEQKATVVSPVAVTPPLVSLDD